MSNKRKRVIGTTEEYLAKAEGELWRRLPPSFRLWLMENNGRSIEQVWIYPIRDERDVPSTWDSIVRQYDGGQWPLEQFEDEDFSHLLPFGSGGTGDQYCFDYGRVGVDGEAPVVIWLHETG